MSVVNYALDYVKRFIPKEVLYFAYIRKPNNYGIKISLDKQIKDLVINKVMEDLKFMEGKEIKLQLEGNVRYKVFNVNDYERHTILVLTSPIVINRPVLDVEAITVFDSLNSGEPSGSMVNTFINRGLDLDIASKNYEVITDIERITNSTFLIKTDISYFVSGFIKLRIGYEKPDEFVKPKYYKDFAELILSYCKWDIYNRTIVDINEGIVYSGHEMGKIKELIESYMDEKDKYLELLDKWYKLMKYTQRDEIAKFINDYIGTRF